MGLHHLVGLASLEDLSQWKQGHHRCRCTVAVFILRRTAHTRNATNQCDNSVQLPNTGGVGWSSGARQSHHVARCYPPTLNHLPFMVLSAFYVHFSPARGSAPISSDDPSSPFAYSVASMCHN